MNPAETASIPITQLHPNPNQPRTFFDENGLGELAASIRQFGLLQPLVVRPVDDDYELIAGERRWRAAQRAGLQELPCRVLRGLADVDAFILSVTENVARRDLNPIEEAVSYQRIVACGRTIEETAALFGKQPETVQYRIDLLGLREDVQALVAHGQLKVGPAWYLCRISLDGQAEVMRKINAGELPTDDAICRYAAAVRVREESPDLFGSSGDDERDEWAEQRRRVQRSRVQAAWLKIEALGSAFGPILELSPEELAATMGQDTPLYRERLEMVSKTARRAQSLLRQAEAFHQATRGQAA